MNEIKLLILDDDQGVIDSYNEIIRRINRDDQTSFSYKVYPSKTLGEASEIIKYNKLDTAIIDLNLNNGKQDDPDNADGNHAIKELMQNFRMPIFVVSGELTKLDDKLQSNDLIIPNSRDKFTTDNGFESIIPPLYESKSIHYFSRDGFLEQKINKFYWEHLSETIETWSSVEDTYPTDIEKILSRHTVSCLNEQLYVNGNIGSFDRYHPGEMYIIPPIKEHYHTGDIIKKEDRKFIILNPACDIVNMGKLNFYMLAELIELDRFQCFVEYVKTDQVYDDFFDSLNKKGKELYEKYQRNSQGANFHYLPRFDEINKNYLIDFQNLNVVDIGGEEIKKEDGESREDFFQRYLEYRETCMQEYKRIASVSSPFLKDIIARFSAYYARQGQPNLL